MSYFLTLVAAYNQLIFNRAFISISLNSSFRVNVFNGNKRHKLGIWLYVVYYKIYIAELYKMADGYCCFWFWNVDCILLSFLKNKENIATCKEKPTLVAKPYIRVDFFDSKMQGVLLTSLLVTIIDYKTVAHIGTSDGRLLQVQLRYANSWW